MSGGHGRPWRSAWLAVGLVVAGCVGDPPSPPAGAGSSGGSTTTTGVDGSGGSSGTATTSTTAVGSSGAGSSGGSSSSSDDGSSACTMPGRLELGAACTEGCDCISEECYVLAPLGGVCSGCDADEDCARTTGYGCNPGNPQAGVPAVCSETGQWGEGCESSEACADGWPCRVVVEVPGIITISSCSECMSDADCSGGQLCGPLYDIDDITGFFRCVEPGSVFNGQGCDLGGSGDQQCQSERCVPASLMGIPVLGICAPCSTGADCASGICQLPELVLDGTTLVLVPGGCA